ncbi:5-amino-6-(5-phospho-D-ribitylamino)uracil phosphatase YigB [Hafnia alvei]|uniref:5-amino-6-(5-phospho-D-ribitylamino)uracil phosphatase YigB n=1 Tax=Hafnia alvei TaxID=569 RepID=UPI00061D34E8|nr:5-amino-6-(5-phospho-D-ribitylamino)uracil phosphatase YigB [Hafnia alvei]KID00845.2 flavin mononucleotide phosphatase [Hafnia alvei]MBW3475590.1 5-amino-6-(5-phospho-D-ribitylamino)uracil phosphatase YigB [Hafnia alvei]TBM12842.1 5-amino-6-(5-phospho-D-ribitylamino)uracil phosphatase YigB [Hafnia alvei]
MCSTLHFYRPLNAIGAFTFDLDDTLYDNHPVIIRTERESLAFLQQNFEPLRDWQSPDWQRLRAELRAENPEIYHDVTAWRWQAVHLALTRNGFNHAQASAGADSAMENFAYWRSQITVPESTHTTLQALAEKAPLAAITNGNADPNLFGLADYFAFILRSGPDGRAKPYNDMYRVAQQRLNVPMRNILHVGDDLTTDVAGAVRCGMQACWINDRERSLTTASDSRLLPHVEISRLDSLTALI